MSYPPTIGKPTARVASPIAQSIMRAARNLHWVVSTILIVSLVPASRLAGLPLHINWTGFFSDYWAGLMIRSIFAATILYVVGFHLRETLIPLFEHYWRQKPRFLVLALFAVAMLWEFGWTIGLMLIVCTVAFLEFFDRIEGDPIKLQRSAREALVPAAYLFVGLVLVFCYNDIIASLKFAASYDAAFNRLDSILLRGMTVSQIAHAAMRWIPARAFSFLEFVYFGMFSQLGAALVITALCSSMKRALAYVGTMLTAYYLALLIFFIWPSMGPFAIRPEHFLDLAGPLDMYKLQEAFVLKARLLWTHRLVPIIDTDYYIGFPCMHIAQPMIALWFLRKWKRIVVALVSYDIFLVASILLLEQHYFVDLLGGALVAALAILMVTPRDSGNQGTNLAGS